MTNIIICDDDKVFGELLKKKLEELCQKESEEWKIRVYEDGQVMMNAIEGKIDLLVFLDICMPKFSGFDIMKEMKMKKIEATVVFVTSFDHCVFKALAYFPFYFLRKSKIEQELPLVIDTYLERKRKNAKIFRYKNRSGLNKLWVKDIIYMVYWNHGITVYCVDGNIIKFRGRIKDCEVQLKEPDFYKVNAGCIVNMGQCEKIEKETLIMSNSHEIVVSRERRKRVKELFLQEQR